MPAYSKVNFFPFEQALSSDVNRIQQLASRELLDMLMKSGGRDAESKDSDGTPNYAGAGGGGPIVGCDEQPGIVSPISNSTFQLTVSKGQAYRSTTPISPDDSAFNVLRWNQTTLSFSPPAVQDRIDMIIARPGVQQADPLLRNILLDPVARTVAQQTVNKTQNPLATLVVVPGTPAANAGISLTVPELVDGILLFEVFVGAGAASAVDFVITPQCFRRAFGPISSYTGVMAGCEMRWQEGNELGGSDVLPFISPAVERTPIHRVCIDGEVLTYGLFEGSTVGIGTRPDLNNHPFTSPAPLDNDEVFYVYACGGRHARLADRGTTLGPMGPPFILIASKTVPVGGRASAALRTDVQTNGADTVIPPLATCFIGCGWKVADSTNSKSILQEGDWFYACAGSFPFSADPICAFNEVFPAVPTDPATDNITFLSRPPMANAAKVIFMAGKTGGTLPMQLIFIGPVSQDPNPSEIARISVQVASASLLNTSMMTREIRLNDTFDPHLRIRGVTAGQEAFFQYAVQPYAYRIPVPRLGGSN